MTPQKEIDEARRRAGLGTSEPPVKDQPRAPLRPDESIQVRSVRVVDIQMPFWSMVEFMVKTSLASIPALIILFMVFAAAFALLRGIFKVA